MSPLLISRICAAFCIDGSLAVTAGCLLSARWIRTSNPYQVTVERVLFRLRLSATGSLLVALCAHFYLLTAEFSGAASLFECFRQMPSIISTHMGGVDIASIALAALLLGFASPRKRAGSRSISVAAMLCGLLLLRSSSGHAAADGAFSLSVALQAVHLGSTVMWSGTILVSGLGVFPTVIKQQSFSDSHAKLDAPSNHVMQLALSREGAPFWLAYMKKISGTSTWAVCLVILSGLLKSYRALNGHASELRSGAWGFVLVAKATCVGVALCLGALNRIRLKQAHRARGTAAKPVHGFLTSLRAEALAMVAILALSAVLGNIDPPDLS